tara:strand:- start:117 stop:545 length:429 start_codon:yes stop_codon:yes gene_type:complete
MTARMHQAIVCHTSGCSRPIAVAYLGGVGRCRDCAVEYPDGQITGAASWAHPAAPARAPASTSPPAWDSEMQTRNDLAIAVEAPASTADLIAYCERLQRVDHLLRLAADSPPSDRATLEGAAQVLLEAITAELQADQRRGAR